MKPVILILLMSIIVFSQCDNLPVIGKSNSEKESIYSKITLMCFFVRLGGGPHGYKVIDNNDGTVSLVSYSSMGSEYCPPPFGKTESTSVIYYIKKCIQGQVYRQAQNDCKGTGTAANYWGAQKFQWCTANDDSCIKLYGTVKGIDYSKSPAGISCNTDISTPIKSFGLFLPSFAREFNLKGLYADSPNSSTDYYWSVDIANVLANSEVIAENFDFKQESFAKTDFNYVLCGKKVI